MPALKTRAWAFLKSCGGGSGGGGGVGGGGDGGGEGNGGGAGVCENESLWKGSKGPLKRMWETVAVT